MTRSILSAFARTLSALAIASVVQAPAQAGTRCQLVAADGTERCVSGLPATLLLQMQQSQHSSHWSVPASISMILRRYGLVIRQEEVAEQMAAGKSPTAEHALTELDGRLWQDRSGRQLEASMSPLPHWRRALGVAAPEVLTELDAGRPLLLGVQGRAMVLVQLVYERPGGGRDEPRIVRAVVLDPAAPAYLRSLKRPEWAPEYLARVVVKGGAQLDFASHDIPAPGSDAGRPVAAAGRPQMHEVR